MSTKLTIESLSVELLRAGFSAKETLERVRRVFPSSQTSIKCIYYYSSKYKIGLTAQKEVDQDELARVRKEMLG